MEIRKYPIGNYAYKKRVLNTQIVYHGHRWYGKVNGSFSLLSLCMWTSLCNLQSGRQTIVRISHKIDYIQHEKAKTRSTCDFPDQIIAVELNNWPCPTLAKPVSFYCEKCGQYLRNPSLSFGLRNSLHALLSSDTPIYS